MFYEIDDRLEFGKWKFSWACVLFTHWFEVFRKYYFILIKKKNMHEMEFEFEKHIIVKFIKKIFFVDWLIDLNSLTIWIFKLADAIEQTKQMHLKHCENKNQIRKICNLIDYKMKWRVLIGKIQTIYSLLKTKEKKNQTIEDVHWMDKAINHHKSIVIFFFLSFVSRRMKMHFKLRNQSCIKLHFC